ncbi:helix-turn-helix domain-containing protein [Chitinophaga ginsengisoli]|uniref:AraC-like DNA-binding protein n=1 Tax=Chitinophaga ginsengisoli TaxID=363837 RepID=A0A2P8GE02_9BACT|nr:AraC family transcriptional regulator [Chitinophaga ginsengisoli]PSL32181.1 AraC-like DNA-binding protein [Chitinophaga ginsengisoli]
MAADRYMNSLSGPRILVNNYDKELLENEAFVTDHIFSYIVAGFHEVWSGNHLYTFKAGDYRLFKRNQLTKSAKRAGQQGFKSIAVHIDQGTLKEMATSSRGAIHQIYIGKDIELLKPNGYLESYIDSLTPYLGATGKYNEEIIALKTKELTLILLQTNPLLRGALFDFNDPGKIDLIAFMNAHYRYNVGLDRMAFLSGRSLSTFKRDFKRAFNATAGRWLTQKRLEEAHYLIHQKGKTASEIYLDLGFEDLSHFSFAYKKAFGNAPSKKTD